MARPEASSLRRAGSPFRRMRSRQRLWLEAHPEEKRSGVSKDDGFHAQRVARP
jgi:hypothetical protein